MRADFDANCRQAKLSVVEFKETFSNSWKTLVANGENEVPEEELAMMFLSRLDMTRYGAMYTEMQNDDDKGLPFPEAFTIAVNRKDLVQSLLMLIQVLQWWVEAVKDEVADEVEGLHKAEDGE